MRHRTLSSRTNIVRSFISGGWERGRTQPYLQSLSRIAVAYNTDGFHQDISRLPFDIGRSDWAKRNRLVLFTEMSTAWTGIFAISRDVRWQGRVEADQLHETIAPVPDPNVPRTSERWIILGELENTMISYLAVIEGQKIFFRFQHSVHFRIR